MGTMIDKADIAQLIPHAGQMALLDAVVDWDLEKICCVTRTHQDKHNPMRINGELPTLCGVEYAAQAMAVHGGLVGVVGNRPRAGYLASLRDVVCSRKRLDDLSEELKIKAEQLMGDESRVIYQFTLCAGPSEILSGRATVLLEVK